MSKYGEKNITNSTYWKRAGDIRIRNPVNGLPSLSFREEEAVEFPNGEVISRPSETLTEALTAENVTTEFPLISPATDLPLNQTVNYRQVHILLHSLYIHLAIKRDRGPQPYDSWTWDETEGDWVAPIAEPTPSVGFINGWDETVGQWVEIPESEGPADDGFEYKWDAPSSSWMVWREAR